MAKSKKPQTTTDPQAADGVSSKLDGAFLESVQFAEPDGGAVDEDAPQLLDEQGQVIGETLDVEPEPDRLDRAAFYTTIKAVLGMPAFYDPDFKPLAVQEHEEDQARAASDACFELLEIWYPAALEQNNPTLGNLLIAVPFLAAKVMIVRDIMRTKKAAAIAANSNHPPAANDNRAPTISEPA